MSPLKPRQKGDETKNLRQLALLAAIPALLIAAPLAGFFLGKWADSKLGSEPYLTILGLILGFAAAGKEIHSVVKRVSSNDNEK